MKHQLSFLSKIPLQVTYHSFQGLWPPGKEVVKALCTTCKDVIANGAKSIDCPHITMHRTPRLPLWAITYWTEVLSLHKTPAPWVLADEALHKRWQAAMKKTKTQQLLDDVYLALSTLEWSGCLKGCGESTFWKYMQQMSGYRQDTRTKFSTSYYKT